MKSEDAEVIAFLKSLPKEAIREALAESSAKPAKKSHKIILKGLVIYHNKCLLCGREWEREEEIQFTLTRTSKPGALIRREFTWCDKCSTVLLGFTKEEIIQRAIKIAVKTITPTKEVRCYGNYPCNPLREEWNSKFGSEEDELLEESNSKMYKGRADEQEVREEPSQELEISEGVSGRVDVVVALLGWEGGMSI